MFNKKLKNRIAVLEEQNANLLEKNIALTEKLNKVNARLSELEFSTNNPPKFNVAEEVKEGIILERRFVNNAYPNCFSNSLFNAMLIVEVTRVVLLKKPESKVTMSKLKDFVSMKYWEYRVFNKQTGSEKWIHEKYLTKPK
ncbi:hypothetical protein COY27_01175 [Candidatus Woesearchaeota archaeon CG_4_10_14_0_2_um_filter_33_13]|nr:MAG: hypothetical protein COY27_01175 [Candidatus Woesearchaeota archaeon CG_4_10_14_0_2_um_filter_33_13]